MKNLSYTLLAVALLAVAMPSCENLPGLDIPLSGDESEITFSTSIKTRATDTEFASGDVINVTSYLASVAIDSDVSYTFDGSIFKATSDAITKEEPLEYGYKAIYPALSTKSGSVRFAVESDQTSQSGYTLSDLMTSSAASTEEAQPKLTFTHLLTKVVLNITSDVELTGAVISAKGEVEYDVLSNIVETTDADAQPIAMKAVTPTSKYTNSYEVIVAPQSVENMDIEISSADAKYTVTYNDAVEMASGYVYTATITVEDETAEIVNLDFSGDIDDWIGGGDLNSGATMKLAELSANSYPAEYDTWIITDTTAEAEDFAGLRGAIEALSESGRAISLEFPRLEEIPDCAIFGEMKVSSELKADALVSIKAAVATRVGSDALSHCESLAVVDFPNAVRLGNSAFSDSGLVEVSLPKVTEIGISTFFSCDNLISLDFSEPITWIGGSAFNGCIRLREVNMQSDYYVYEEGVIYTTDKTQIISALAAVMPHNFRSESAQLLANGALRACYNLQMVDLPNAIFLDSQAISGCWNLQTALIPNVETIGPFAFSFSNHLTHVYAHSATTVEMYAFGWCNSLVYLQLASRDDFKLAEFDRNAFVNTYTKDIDMVLSEANREYVDAENVQLTVGNFSAEFNSITVGDDRYARDVHVVELTQFGEEPVNGEQSITLDGISYKYNNTYSYTNGSNYYITSLVGGYLYNTTELIGLKKIAIKLDNMTYGYDLFVGNEEGGLRQIDYTKNGSFEYVYEVPEGCTRFWLQNSSDQYQAYADRIELTFDSIGTTDANLTVPDDAFYVREEYSTDNAIVFAVDCTLAMNGCNIAYVTASEEEFNDAAGPYNGDINALADDGVLFFRSRGVDPTNVDFKYIYAGNYVNQPINVNSIWAIEPGVSYVTAIYAIDANGQRASNAVRYDAVASGEHTPEKPEYSKWLGNWEFSCTATNGEPLSMEVSIEPLIDDYSYRIRGFDISYNRLAYSVEAYLRAGNDENGEPYNDLVIMSEEAVAYYISEGDISAGKAYSATICSITAEDGSVSQSRVSSRYNAFAASMGDDESNCLMLGLAGELNDGRAFKADSKTLFFDDYENGYTYLYNNDPAYKEGVRPTSPYNLAKLSSVASAPRRISSSLAQTPDIYTSAITKALNAPQSMQVVHAVIGQ